MSANRDARTNFLDIEMTRETEAYLRRGPDFTLQHRVEISAYLAPEERVKPLNGLSDSWLSPVHRIAM